MKRAKRRGRPPGSGTKKQYMAVYLNLDGSEREGETIHETPVALKDAIGIAKDHLVDDNAEREVHIVKLVHVVKIKKPQPIITVTSV